MGSSERLIKPGGRMRDVLEKVVKQHRTGIGTNTRATGTENQASKSCLHRQTTAPETAPTVKQKGLGQGWGTSSLGPDKARDIFVGSCLGLGVS